MGDHYLNIYISGPYTLFAPTEEVLTDLVKRLGGTQGMLKKMGKANLVKVRRYFVNIPDT